MEAVVDFKVHAPKGIDAAALEVYLGYIEEVKNGEREQDFTDFFFKDLAPFFGDSAYMPYWHIQAARGLEHPSTSDRAIAEYERIISSYETFELKEKAYYKIYELSAQRGDAAKAAQYRKEILTQYPDSNYLLDHGQN